MLQLEERETVRWWFQSVSYKAEFYKILLDIMLEELHGLENKDRRTSQPLDMAMCVMNFQQEDRKCSMSQIDYVRTFQRVYLA